MKKYTLTTVDKLKPGDTFWKEGDLNEIVYTVSELKSMAKEQYYVKKGELRMIDIMNKNEPIIFLNHGK